MAIKTLTSKWLCSLEQLSIIQKDSLEFTSKDRIELLATISQATQDKIIVVHGTDTMDITAAYLAECEVDKAIVLTGAMQPYSIDPVEATANLASAYGYLRAKPTEGVYIAMHGNIDYYDKIKKDRTQGLFIYDSQR